jgi:hypothetical protein
MCEVQYYYRAAEFQRHVKDRWEGEVKQLSQLYVYALPGYSAILTFYFSSKEDLGLWELVSTNYIDYVDAEAISSKVDVKEFLDEEPDNKMMQIGDHVYFSRLVSRGLQLIAQC